MAGYCDSDPVLSTIRTLRLIALLLALPVALWIAGCSSEDKEQPRGLAAGQFDADSHLPGSLPGISLAKMSVCKTEADLEQYMGARSNDYYTYRLVGLAAALYDADSARLSVEVAQFASPLDAYGFYALTRPDSAYLTKLGAEGYMEGNSFYFVNGHYVVTVSAIADNGGGSDLVQRLGVSIGAEIGLDDRLPTEFEVFPEDGRILATYRYVPFDYVGVSELDSVLTCRYRVDTAECTVFCTGDRSGKKFLALSAYADSLGGGLTPVQEIGFDENYGGVFIDPVAGSVTAGLVAGRLVGAVGGDPASHAAVLATWVELLRAQ